MNELVTVTTRISKDLKQRIKDFSKINGIKSQIIYNLALNEFLQKYKSKEANSETTLFLRKKLFEASDKRDSKSHELVENLLELIEKHGIELDEETDMLKFEYEQLSNLELATFELYEDSLR